MIKATKDLLRSTRIEPSLVGVGNLVSGVIGGVFWLVLASIVPISEYGEMNYYISVSTILSILSLLGLNLTVMTYLPKGNHELKRQADIIILLSSSIVASSIWAFTQNLALALMCLGMGFFTMTNAQILGEKKYRKFPILVIGQRISQFGFSLGFYLLMGIDGLFLGYGLSLLLFSYSYIRGLITRHDHAISASLQNKNDSTKQIRFGAIRSKSKFITHAYMTSVAQTMSSYSDKLLIGPLFGFAVLGLYQLGFQFLLFLTVIPISLTQYLIPQESAGVHNVRVVKIGLLIAIVIGVTSFLIIGPTIRWLFPLYTEAIPAASIMVLAVIPMTVNAVINARLLGTERSFPVVLGAVAYISSLFVLMYLLGTGLGLVGLAIALVAALSIQSAILVSSKYLLGLKEHGGLL